MLSEDVEALREQGLDFILEELFERPTDEAEVHGELHVLRQLAA